MKEIEEALNNLGNELAKIEKTKTEEKVKKYVF
jgi:hypothetical protein